MKINFLCVDSGSKIVATEKGEVNKGGIVYYAKFGVAKEKGESVTYFGTLQLEAFNQMHYKPGRKYVINISIHPGVEEPIHGKTEGQAPGIN